MEIMNENKGADYFCGNCRLFVTNGDKIKLINFYHFSRAIVFAWIVIITTAIPVAITHGETQYVWKGQNNSACGFLNVHYNQVAFQVSQVKPTSLL